MAKVALIDLVNVPAFEEVADLFHRTTGMTFSFPDREGNILFYPHRGRCAFCQLIQSVPGGRERCRISDKQAAEIALRDGRPMSYTCHAGLIDVVVPVVVGEERIGAFYSGQSLLSPPTPIGFRDVLTRVADLGLDEKALWDAYRAVTQVDSYKLEVALELLSIMSSHLVQGQMELRRERELARAAEHRARLEKNLREMELRLSQAQFNPHFLFNSLNLILGEALNEDASRTAHLVEELSVLLSGAVTAVGSKVDLNDEIASARGYVEMFRARFGKSIHFRADLPRKLTRVQVPALILQPLVENALVHGFPKCSGSFAITVSARMAEDLIEVTVADNGPGASERGLAALSRSINSRRHKSKLTGLVGLSQRLRYYYPDLKSLRIERPAEGFAVTISIPSPASATGVRGQLWG